MKNCAYIFIDESGNFDFSPTGTDHFVLTGVIMRRPLEWLRSLDSYRHDCLERGEDVEQFHCAEEKIAIRVDVFDLIATHIDKVAIESVVIEKNKTDPDLWQDSRFYPEMLGRLLQSIVPAELNRGADEIIIITDRIPMRKRRRAVEKSIKQSLAKILPGNVPYHIYHHEARSHYGIQVADYCCWAIYRKWKSRPGKYYAQIASAIRSEADIFATATRRYY